MANTNKTYLDLAGLQTYDALIKNYIDTEDAKSIKTVLWDSDNEKIKFYTLENATLSDEADFEVTISSSDVEALQERVGIETTLNTYQSQDDITNILNVLTGGSSTAGSVSKALADAEAYADGKVEALDVTEFAIGEKDNNDVITIHGIKQTDGAIAVGDTAANDIEFAVVAATGAAEDVSYDNTTSELTATDVQAAIDEVQGNIDTVANGLGTAAAADIATDPIVEDSEDDNLVSAAQVAAFVADEIAGLEGAMHFRGVITRQSGETDAQAIARVIDDPESGDVVVMSDNAKEYVYDGTDWREVGDEGLYVQKTTTIAGVDLQDNITKTELLTALNVADGAQVNVLEGVQVNGTDLSISNKKVNVTVAEGSTNGTVAVNGSDVSVHGLGSAAYTASSAYDAAGTAAGLIEDLDTENDVVLASYTAGTSGAADVITFTGSIAESDGIIGEGSEDTITLSTITETQINNLFS